jgi:hypothetical protein
MLCRACFLFGHRPGYVTTYDLSACPRCTQRQGITLYEYLKAHADLVGRPSDAPEDVGC